MSGGPVGRFAPSPSGRMHLGNLFSSLLAWLSAKSAGGRIVLRLEDLDTQRCTRAFAAQVVYIAIGAIGLPVFSGFKSGPQVLLGATGGYLVAYPLMALVLSLVCQHFKGFLPRLVGVILAVALCYTFGTAWFMFMSGNDLATSLAWCVTPFVIPDLIKGVCALLLAKALESRLNRAAA